LEMLASEPGSKGARRTPELPVVVETTIAAGN
jgi:hypothetical protein